MPFLKPFPEGPYLANIFISELSENLEGYEAMDKETIDLAFKQAGFIGYESVRNGTKGIFISYWESEAAVDAWRQNSVHIAAKHMGRSQFYSSYVSQMCIVQTTRSNHITK